MAYTGLYNSEGQILTTVVDGTTRTGLYSADGNYNIVINDGTTIKGLHHPCGAYWAVVVADTSGGYYAPNGSVNVISDGGGGYVLAFPNSGGEFLPHGFSFLLGADGDTLLGADDKTLYGVA